MLKDLFISIGNRSGLKYGEPRELDTETVVIMEQSKLKFRTVKLIYIILVMFAREEWTSVRVTRN